MLGWLRDWLVEHKKSAKILPRALFGAKSSGLWQSTPASGTVTIYLGEYQQKLPEAHMPWIIRMDASVETEIIRFLSWPLFRLCLICFAICKMFPRSDSSSVIMLSNTKLTVGSDNTSTTFAGTIGNAASTTGGVTKVGTGVFKLSGSNSYTGNTVVSAGSLLAVNTAGSATGSGNVTVSSGATLGGSGTITPLSTNAVTIQSGGILAPYVTASSFNTLTINGTLNLNARSIMDINLGGSANDEVIAQSVVFGGSSETLNVAFPGGIVTGLFPILQAGSFSGQGAPVFTITGSPSDAYTILAPGAAGNTFANTYALDASTQKAIWTGADSGNWNTTDANWNGPTGTTWTVGLPVVFDDTAQQFNVATQTGGTGVQPDSITYNNNYHAGENSQGLYFALKDENGNPATVPPVTTIATGGAALNLSMLISASSNASTGALSEYLQMDQQVVGGPLTINQQEDATHGGGWVKLTNPANTFDGLTLNSGLLILQGGLGSAGSGPITVNGGGVIVRVASAASVFTLRQSGYNDGAWNGSTGISSTAAATDPSHLHALGFYQPAPFTSYKFVEDDVINGVGNVNGPTNTSPGDVAIKYTYYGDANLDGIVDGSDYTLIDNALNSQGAQISAQVASPTAQIAGGAGSSSVPEPTTLGLLGIGAAGLLGRRAGRRHR